MLKKSIFLIAMLTLILCIFTISAGAVTGSTSDEFGEVTVIEGITVSSLEDKTSRAVLKNADGTYSTYYAYYFVTKPNSSFHGFDQSADMDFSQLNEKTEESYSAASIIRFEYPKDATAIRLPSACKDNLVELYIPDDSKATTLPGYSFGSYTALKKVYVGATEMTETGTQVFGNCASLEEVVFSKNSKITKMGGNTFLSCTALKKVVLPNSVQTLGAAFFGKCTSLEEIYLGESLTTIGDNAFNFTQPVRAYMPATAFDSRTTIGNSCFYSWDSAAFTKVTVYFCGTQEQAEALKAKGTHAGVKNASLVAWDQSKADSYYAPTEEQAAWTLVYNYSSCKAFYDGVHLGDDGNCATACTCTRGGCGITLEAKEHQISESVSYASLASNGYYDYCCTNDGCVAVDKETETLKPVVEPLGYSTDGKSIRVGYKINLDELEIYERLISELDIGFVAVNANSVPDGESLLVNGELSSAKGITQQITSRIYSHLSCEISGFDATTSASLELVMAIYAIDKAGAVSYVQSASAWAINTDINGESFGKVTLDLAKENLL